MKLNLVLHASFIEAYRAMRRDVMRDKTSRTKCPSIRAVLMRLGLAGFSEAVAHDMWLAADRDKLITALDISCGDSGVATMRELTNRGYSDAEAFDIRGWYLTDKETVRLGF